ncbi:hypothetical protein [Magnetospirillum sp. UT-4]|uniref:hypothetical protein n=1 Tax=Magnetospirillum sp. UT-4 TaxID=2681467 RepID=UPI00137E93AD|nr:hypothetical protein [Magnetospirillum sp. UT-4]CAA7613960.1 putative NHL repeat containing protein [Magnetospirillum sp. UT-4]
MMDDPRPRCNRHPGLPVRRTAPPRPAGAAGRACPIIRAAHLPAMRPTPALVMIAALLAACTQRPLQTARDMEPPPLPGAAIPARGDLVLPTGYDARPMAAGLVDPRAILFDAAGRPLVVEGEPARLTRVEADGSLTSLAQGGGNGPWSGGATLDGRIYVAESGGPLGGRILAVAMDGTVSPLPVELPGGGLVGPLAAGPDGWLHVAVAAPASDPGIPCQDRPGIIGRLPCTGAVLRIAPAGGRIALHSWGWRAPTALAFAADGRLLVADREAEGGAGLHRAVAGVWYGWPDTARQLALTDPELADLPNPPPPPLARPAGAVAALATGAAPDFGGGDDVFAALSGPAGTGQGGTGTVAFADIGGGTVVPFAANLASPQALAFPAAGDSLWVADGGSGTLWRITRHPAAGTARLPPAAASATPQANDRSFAAWTASPARPPPPCGSCPWPSSCCSR